MDGRKSSSCRGPTDFTNILNDPASPMRTLPTHPKADHRDSGYSSKHTSADSTAVGGNVLGAARPGYQSVHGQQLSSGWPAGPRSSLFSPSASNPTVSSMMASPTTPSSADTGRFERPTSIELVGVPNDDSLNTGHPQSNSRRASVDSRFNQQMGNVRLGGSTYGSQNNSATSFQHILHMPQPARPNADSSSITNRISNGYQPNAHRAPDMLPKTVRTAPAITGPATGNIARAAEPTKGQAWAFPEADMNQVDSRRSSMADSMADSMTDSLASSQYHSSRFPAGQKSLSGRSEYGGASGELSSGSHSFRHGGINGLLHADQNSSQPYSRSPALRVSHKMAERKRRTEMKELFDQLRDMMPQERGSKASKWEILTKAIAEHARQEEVIRTLQQREHHLIVENEHLRHDYARAKTELAQARSDLNSAYRHVQHGQPSQYGHESYPQTSRHDQLPPLRSISNSINSLPESMPGLQYTTNDANNRYQP